MAEQNPLGSLTDYSHYIARLVDRPTIQRSTLVVWSLSPYTGVAEGELLFSRGFKLRVLEELDFEAQLITGYSYEVYQNDERLYWYDDYPHPHDPELATTHPHHRHMPPDIKHHRVPAPGISFTQPNLRFLIQEVEQSIKG